MALVPVNGTVVEVGPDEAAPEDTTFSRVVIRQEDGKLREFVAVRAIYAVAGLVERDGIGTFVFCNRPAECRLVFVYRDTGARAADCDALYIHFESAAHEST
jgi:hypothetical protein